MVPVASLAIVLGLIATAVHPVQVSTASVAQGCKNNEDCTLSGVCSSTGACICNDGWTSADCHLLAVSPAGGPAPGGAGYGVTPNVTSWGGSIIAFTPAAPAAPATTYHLFVTEEQGGCGK